MAPPIQRRQISKDRFGIVFGSLKSQSYIDPPVRGAASHMFVCHICPWKTASANVEAATAPSLGMLPER